MQTTPRNFRVRLGQIAGGGLALVAMLFWGQAAQAQSLIRDAEIEFTLRRVAAPLFKSAGLGARSVEMLVINDPSLNAFVINSRAIFLHSGLIMRLSKVDQLQSVIGHELAHITSGHLVRRALNQENAMTAIGIGILLAAALSASSKTNAAAGGLAIGAAGSAIGNLLAHTRAEEATADQIGTQYLVMAGIDPRASIKALEIFKGQEALSVGRQDAYVLTHPLSDDRIRNLKSLADIYGGQAEPTDPELLYWFDRMRAKFKGFLGAPSYTLRRVKAGDMSEPARLTRAIAYHRLPDTAKAMAEINGLLAIKPDDAYYHELKGQFLLENGQASLAAPAYEKAVSLAPDEALILAGYGRALLAIGTTSTDAKALELLNHARDMDPRDAGMLRDLALAYAKSGDNGMASLVTAERYALLTRFKDAQTNALRAEGLLARGSSGWLRAQDIIAATKPALTKN